MVKKLRIKRGYLSGGITPPQLEYNDSTPQQKINGSYATNEEVSKSISEMPGIDNKDLEGLPLISSTPGDMRKIIKVQTVLPNGTDFADQSKIEESEKERAKLRSDDTSKTTSTSDVKTKGTIDKFTGKLVDIWHEIGEGKRKIEKVAGTNENLKGLGSFGSGPDDDKYAIRGGSKYTAEQIRNEELQYNEKEKEITDKIESYTELYNKAQSEEIRFEKEALNAYREYQDMVHAPPGSVTEKDLRDAAKNYEMKRKKRDDAINASSRYQTQIDRQKDILKTNDKLKILLEEKRASYGMAVVKGKDLYTKEHSWRKEWMQPIGENATAMMGHVTIRDADKLADFGGKMTTSKGFASIIEPIKVSPGANNWTRTQVGDRGLVESLVKVNRNNMIAPFGMSGTIGGSQLTSQFNYNTPLRRIDIGDITSRTGWNVIPSEVTAKPRYRLTPEDIRRKKNNKIKPMISRKNISITNHKKTNNIPIEGVNIPNSKKSNINQISVGGSLNLGNSKAVIANIGKCSTVKLNKNGVLTFMNPEKIKNEHIQSSNINIEKEKPYSVKMKMNGVSLFTSKNVENNLNNISKSMKKKVKV